MNAVQALKPGRASEAVRTYSRTVRIRMNAVQALKLVWRGVAERQCGLELESA